MVARAAEGGLDLEPGCEFLGREFLLWLWWQAETQGGLHPLAGGERAGIALDRLLEFVDAESGVRVVVRGDAPTRAPEAREALARGTRLERAGLIVGIGGTNVALVLDGARFDLRSVKGEPPEGDSREERDAEALGQLFAAQEALDLVYATFIRERLSERFVREVAPRLREWAGTRRAAAPEAAGAG